MRKPLSCCDRINGSSFAAAAVYVHVCARARERVLFHLLFNRKWHAADLFTKSQLCLRLLSVSSTSLQTHLGSNLLPTLDFDDDHIYIYIWHLNTDPAGADSRYLVFAHLTKSWRCLSENNAASGVSVDSNNNTRVWPPGGEQHKY